MANISRKRASQSRVFFPPQGVGDSDLQRELSAIDADDIFESLSNASRTAAKNQQYKVLPWAVLLIGFQLYAVSASSLSLLTATINSTVNLLFLVASHLHQIPAKTNTHRVPIVTSRIESAGQIFCAFIMITTATICTAISCQEILRDHKSVSTLIPIIVMSGTFIVRFCVSCYTSRAPESAHEDLFIHGLGILMSIGGMKIRWWIDALGAIILSVLISWKWARRLIHELKLLVGVSADMKTQNSIRDIGLAHDDRILNVGSVRAYHAGSQLVVEIDIVMSPRQTLRVSRDVAKGLQSKLERFPRVERAFVHVAYETREVDLRISEPIK